MWETEDIYTKRSKKEGYNTTHHALFGELQLLLEIRGSVPFFQTITGIFPSTIQIFTPSYDPLHMVFVYFWYRNEIKQRFYEPFI